MPSNQRPLVWIVFESTERGEDYATHALSAWASKEGAEEEVSNLLLVRPEYDRRVKRLDYFHFPVPYNS